MTLLNKRELSRMGLIGPAEAYTNTNKSVTVFPSFMAVLEEGKATQVDKALPGDLVVIASEISLDPRQTLVAGEYCPKLYDVGEVSGQHYFFPDHSGILKVVVRVTKEFRIDQIPYLIRLISLGETKI